MHIFFKDKLKEGKKNFQNLRLLEKGEEERGAI